MRNHEASLSTGRRCWARPNSNQIFQARTRILIYHLVWARFKPQIKNITINFEETLMKKKMSFTHPQSHQLRITIFMQGVFFALSHQSRKPYRLLKISISLLCPSRLKPDNFSKWKLEPGQNPTRLEKLELDWQLCCLSYLGTVFRGSLVVVHCAVRMSRVDCLSSSVDVASANGRLDSISFWQIECINLLKIWSLSLRSGDPDCGILARKVSGTQASSDNLTRNW